MLSLFPQLFVFQFFAPTILRIVLGIALILRTPALDEEPVLRHGKLLAIVRAIKHNRPLTIIRTVTAVLLILGFLTQAAALLTIVITIFDIVKKREKINGLSILTIAIALALLVLGPGAFAIDLPL